MDEPTRLTRKRSSPPLRVQGPMGFELRLERAAPPLSSDDPRAVALAFLRKVGVVSAGFDPLGGGSGGEGSAPVRGLVECLLLEPGRSFSAAELAKAVDAPVGQVYRALLKFESLDWVVQADEASKGSLPGKRYRLRFGRLQDAWRFTELAAGLALERYGGLAKALEARVAPHREKPPARPTVPVTGDAGGARGDAFVMRLADDPLPRDGPPKDLALAFLQAVGVIPGRTGGRKPAALPVFRAFYSAFLMGGERWWSFEELQKHAGSTRPTLLKHIRRLESLDLLERAAFPDEFGFPRRHWRLRHGSLARAFEFTDARARLALDSMARWAEHLDKLVAGEGEQPRKAGAKSK